MNNILKNILLICFILLSACDDNPFKDDDKEKKEKENKKKYYAPPDPTYTYELGDDGKCYEVASIEGSTWYEEVCMNYCDDSKTYYDLYEAIYFGTSVDSFCIQYKFLDNGRFELKVKELKQDTKYPVIWHCTGDTIDEGEGVYYFNGILTRLVLQFDNGDSTVKTISSPGDGLFSEYDAYNGRYYDFSRKQECLTDE